MTEPKPWSSDDINTEVLRKETETVHRVFAVSDDGKSLWLGQGWSDSSKFERLPQLSPDTQKALVLLLGLTTAQRVKIFHLFCTSCGELEGEKFKTCSCDGGIHL